jgi:hypothetical protein
MLHLGALGQNEGILDIDAEVTDCALDLRMAECQAPFWNENLRFFSSLAINSENMCRPCSHY